MADTVDSQAIRDLDVQRLRSLVEPNIEAARPLHAHDYQLIMPTGAPISGEDYLGLIERGEMVYEAFEPASEVAVRLYSDVAVVRYLAHIIVRGTGWRDEGQFWHTDLYEVRDGRWQAVWSQATRAAS